MPRNSKNKTTKKDKLTLKEKVSEALELPKELILDIPKITLVGNKQLLVENYKGIIEYEDNKIRLKTHEGVIKLEGTNMIIKEITSEDIMVNGKISLIEFQN